MKNLYQKEVIEAINNEIEKLESTVQIMRSTVVNKEEFLEHLSKRKEQLTFIIDNFKNYMDFVDDHLARKLDVRPMQKKSISIEMAAVDVLLGKRIYSALTAKNIPSDNAEKVSYFIDCGYRLDWLLSHVDVDNTLAEYNDMVAPKVGMNKK